MKASKSTKAATIPPVKEEAAENNYNPVPKDYWEPRMVRLSFADRVRQFGGKITDQVAGHSFWRKNEEMPFCDQVYPKDRSRWQMRYADLFYPHAQGGPLYIDTPLSPMQLEWCKQKEELYRTKGVRYAYVGIGESFGDVMLRLDGRPKAAV